MSDFDRARSLGHNAHRLSIEWSRIEPQPGEWNEEALKHYAALIAALRQRQIEPIVTLHHFTNPAWLARNGVNVLGYLYWTLMDNYESTSGRYAHFGLASCDVETQERLSRPAAIAYKTLIESGAGG